MNIELLRWTHRFIGALAPNTLARYWSDRFLRPQPSATGTGSLAPEWRLSLSHGELFGWGLRPRVLLVHGWSSTPASLEPLLRALLAAGHEVAAVQAPGHGDRPAAISHIEGFTRAVLAAGAELGPLQAVIGHSMGGIASLNALARGLDTRCVATLGAPAGVADAIRRFAVAIGLPARARQHFHRLIEQRVGVPASAFDIPSQAQRMQRPVLLVHDLQDREVAYGEAERMHGSLPGSTLMATLGLGHRRLLRDRHVVERIVQFVGEHAAAARPVRASERRMRLPVVSAERPAAAA